ncbi:MAG: hypothetical protein ABI150_06185 [Nitrobacter sp.]
MKSKPRESRASHTQQPLVSDVSRSGGESLSIAVMSRAELAGCAPWTSTFADQRKDHRYYEILNDTLQDNFEYRYFAILDACGQVRAVQPFFRAATGTTISLCKCEDTGASAAKVVRQHP